MLLQLFLITLAVFAVALFGLALGAITGRRCVRSCSDCATCPKRDLFGRDGDGDEAASESDH